MPFNLVLKPEAIEEITEAYNWYEDQRTGLGEEFTASLTKVFDKLIEKPRLFQKRSKDWRQVKLFKFPYVVIYEIADHDVIVYAVFHTSRDPERITNRV